MDEENLKLILMLRDILDNDFHLGFDLYSARLYKSIYRADAVRIFSDYVQTNTTYYNNLHILSSLATIFVVEHQYLFIYEDICDMITNRIKLDEAK